jgi:hypothetical protein
LLERYTIGSRQRFQLCRNVKMALRRSAPAVDHRRAGQQQVAADPLGALLDAGRKRVIEVAEPGREDGLVGEDAEDPVVPGGEAARGRVILAKALLRHAQ